MKRKYLAISLLFSVLISFGFLSSTLATSWVYPFVVWNDTIYVISDEYVITVDEVIGHVTKYSDMEQYGGNFSNIYNKGTKYYSITGVSTDKAIAIEEANERYKKALSEGEYAYNDKTVVDFAFLLIGSLALLMVVIIILNYYPKKVVRD